MKKINLLILLAFLTAGSIKAQDTLYMVDGTIRIVQIIEVSQSTVKYLLLDNPDGPTVILHNQEIAQIKYMDGRIDSFLEIRKPADSTSELLKEKLTRKNLFSLHLLDLFTGSIAVNYERLSTSGKWGWKIPVSVAYRKWPDYAETKVFSLRNFLLNSSQRVNFSAGFAINYYPNYLEPEKPNFFWGITVLFGKNKINPDPLMEEGTGDLTDIFFYYGLIAGHKYRISDNIDISLQSGLGIARNYNNNPLVHTEINLCYKF
jgi:hypothetical protein